jgi:ANTAR domain
VAEYGQRPASGGGGTALDDVPFDTVVIRRTSAGWRIESACPEEERLFADGLCEAMVLADLLASDIRPGPRPPRPTSSLDEKEQLRLSVRQLEHALAARVRIEQAIGVLAERWRTTPREAFERLRRVARSLGRKVHDLGGDVIASITDPAVVLPEELIPPT